MRTTEVAAVVFGACDDRARVKGRGWRQRLYGRLEVL